jgi:biopolymer transport protein ExbB
MIDYIIQGIHNALITTVGGLCVAIPALVAYNYLARKVEGLVLEVERIAIATVPKKTPQ